MQGWVSGKDYEAMAQRFKIMRLAAVAILGILVIVTILLLAQILGRQSLTHLEAQIESLQADKGALSAENAAMSEQLLQERYRLNEQLSYIMAAIEHMGVLQVQLTETTHDLYAQQEALEAYSLSVEYLQEIINLGSNNVRVDFDNLRVLSNTTEAQLNQILRGSPLENYGWHFLAAERNHRVNALVLIGIIRKESSLGRITAAPNNLAGIRRGGTWATFASQEESIHFLARILDENYLTVGGSFYNGVHLEGVNVRYAILPGGSPNWDWSSGIRTLVGRDLGVIS